MSIRLRRREFIAGCGGAAVWPLAARAQQADRVRRIGVIMSGDENDPAYKTFVSAFTRALAGLGWTDGRNVRMDVRWAGGDINRIRALAHELVGLQPDIILTGGTPATVAFQRETRTIPIVFANVGDPVASGIVPRLNRPGGNVTGFANLEASLGGKWLELLSEIAPGLKRAAIMFDPDGATASTFMPSLETAARSLKLVLTTAPVHSDEQSSPSGASREAALSSRRMHSRPCIARRSYRRRPETTYQRSIGHLALPEMAVCSPTESTW
jgi:putative ABC transport system substrate-binding protein